jgi:hypothetical protein
MAEKLVVIAQFPDYIGAEMARQTLAGGGIEAIVTGANASSVYPLPAIEGPELQVLESQVRRACRILKSHQAQEL